MEKAWLTFAASHDGHLAGAGPTVEDDRLLHPGDEEVGPLADDHFLHAAEPVEDDGPVPGIHCGGAAQRQRQKTGVGSQNPCVRSLWSELQSYVRSRNKWLAI